MADERMTPPDLSVVAEAAGGCTTGSPLATAWLTGAAGSKGSEGFTREKVLGRGGAPHAPA